jgi:hypothetical protein
MRKTDQEKMWEVFVESSNGGVISTGGALKAGGGSSAPKTSNDDEDAEDTDGDPYEDEEGKDELQDILTKCHSGDITAEEAHEHITKMMKGEGEDEENVKRHSGKKNTKEMNKQLRHSGTESSNNNKPGNPFKRTEGMRKSSGVNRIQPKEGRY